MITRAYVHRSPIHMGLSFDGLSAIAKGSVKKDPKSGHLFVFFNRAKTYTKILFWDGEGFVIVAKRLDSEEFDIPQTKEIALGKLTTILGDLDVGWLAPHFTLNTTPLKRAA